MYCTLRDITTLRMRLQDLLSYVDDESMARLVIDEADIPQECMARINTAIQMVSRNIDDVLRGQYSVPLAAPYPERITLIAVDMVLYELAMRRTGELPETITTAYAEATRRLNEIRDRRVKLYDDAPSTGGDPIVGGALPTSVFGGFIP